ncbi:hypothetical protein PG988_010749 [Apiospora saccharicola]
MGAGHDVFGYRHGIAVAQLALFATSLAFGFYFFGGLQRLGGTAPRRNGWFCIGVFSIFRLVGAGCMLSTLSNDDDSVWAGVFVCESFGMVLIVFLLLELMERANKVVPTINPRAFKIPQLLTWADLGLAIAGFASAARRENKHPLAPTSLTRASFGLFTALYLWICGMAYFLLTSKRRKEGEKSQQQEQGQDQILLVHGGFPRDERRALWCVAFCLPLLAVRTAYSLVFQITGDMGWNAVKGRPTPYLAMTFLPELAIIYACVFIIMCIAPPPMKEETEKQDGDRGGILSWLRPSRWWRPRQQRAGGHDGGYSSQTDEEGRGPWPGRRDEENISLVPSRR